MVLVKNFTEASKTDCSSFRVRIDDILFSYIFYNSNNNNNNNNNYNNNNDMYYILSSQE